MTIKFNLIRKNYQPFNTKKKETARCNTKIRPGDTHEFYFENTRVPRQHTAVERANARARGESEKAARRNGAHTHSTRGRHTLHYNYDAIRRWSCERRRPVAAERTARKRNEKASDTHTHTRWNAHARALTKRVWKKKNCATLLGLSVRMRAWTRQRIREGEEEKIKI